MRRRIEVKLEKSFCENLLDKEKRRILMLLLRLSRHHEEFWWRKAGREKERNSFGMNEW